MTSPAPPPDDGRVPPVPGRRASAGDLLAGAGAVGYALPGLSHEGGRFADQTFMSHYHWLPWVTYVEIDPLSRLYDTFGAYDIAGADKLSPQERRARNRIYDSYA